MAVHVGVRGPGHLSRVFGWSPAQLGSSLLGWWDAENAASLALSGTSVTTWTDLVGSYAATQAISGSKPRYDANAFGGVLNKCTNINSNPGALTSVTKSGDAASVLSIVDDSAALAAAGLSAYGPSVFKLDNSAGVAAANANIGGTVASLIPHAGVAYMRGSGNAVLRLSGNIPASSALTSSYVRRTILRTPSTTGELTVVSADAGAVVYFILNGLYEGSSAPTGDVVVNGAAAYGFGRPGVIFDGSDDELTLASVPFPVGAVPCEIWGLVDQRLPGTDATTRRVFSWGSTNAVSRQLMRIVATGANKADGLIGDGASTVDAVNNADFSGRHVVRLQIGATASQTDVDGAAGTPAAVVPGTSAASGRTRIGASPSAASTGFWQGIHSTVLITNPLSADQAAQLTAYLKARGGIA